MLCSNAGEGDPPTRTNPKTGQTFKQKDNEWIYQSPQLDEVVVKGKIHRPGDSDGDSWGQNVMTALRMTLDWAIGRGKDNRIFYNTSEANAFRNSRVIKQLRDYWYAEVRAGRKGILDGVTNFGGKKALTGGNFGFRV